MGGYLHFSTTFCRIDRSPWSRPGGPDIRYGADEVVDELNDPY
ncbi:hypothetical protein NB311A_01704 [Nitrobacter sp. Nb-311A]|nr:hypothetical protein NB311A_01704 [Nitrobacter sp. Nb-311A]